MFMPVGFGHWKNVMFVVAVGKAAVAGAGLGLAILGATDLLLSVPYIQAASDAFDQLSTHYDAFASVGAVTGILAKLFLR